MPLYHVMIYSVCLHPVYSFYGFYTQEMFWYNQLENVFQTLGNLKLNINRAAICASKKELDGAEQNAIAGKMNDRILKNPQN